MTNYIKSEVYRNLKSKGNYIFLFGGMGFAIFLNVALGLFSNSQVNFPYGNTKFSFSSFYASMSLIMILCLPLVATIYGHEFKHHTLKNSISYGIPRNQIYFGKFLMELIISVINLICISGVYIISAYVMLENSGIVYLNELLRSLIACFPLLIMSITVAHCFYFIFENETTVGVMWVGVMVVIPMIVNMAGRGISFLEKVAYWMPWNIMNNAVYDSIAQTLVMHWSSQEGFIECFIVGAIGTIIFYVLGLILFNKREIN